MRLSTERILIGIFALLIPFIPAAKAYALPIVPVKVLHFASRANFVPIKLYTRWRLHSPKQFACLSAIFEAESHWNPFAHNTTAVWMGGKAYYAGGIPQILGLKTSVSPYRQVEAGIRYVNRRYGNSCNALAFHQSTGWY